MKTYTSACVKCLEEFSSIYPLTAIPTCEPCSFISDLRAMAEWGTD